MWYIARIRCLSFAFVYESNPKYWIFGHRLSKANRLEMKNLAHIFLYNFKFQTKHLEKKQMLNFDCSGLNIFLGSKWTLNASKDKQLT